MDDRDTRTEAPPKPHTSFSQLSTYLRCSLMYFFRYIEKMRGRPSLPLVRGKSGHAAVEWNFAKKIVTNEDQPTDQILDLFSDTYDAGIHEFEKSDFMPGDDPDATKDETIELLRFWRLDPKEGAPTVAPIAVEIPFEIDFPTEEDYEQDLDTIVGRIDLLGRRVEPAPKRPKITLFTPQNPAPPPPVEVLDHKFVGKMKNQAEVDLSDQLTLYDMVLQKSGIVVDRVGMEYFVPAGKTTPNRVKQIYRDEALMTPEYRKTRFERLIYKMRTVKRGIMAGIFIPTDNPQVCGRCDYRNQCQFSLAKDDFTALQLMQEASK